MNRTTGWMGKKEIGSKLWYGYFFKIELEEILRLILKRILGKCPKEI
jgi:hypothetical protein